MSVNAMETKRRTMAIFIFIIAVFLIITIRIFVVQFIQGPELQKKALDQWVRDLEVAPTRGSITDRNGNELAKTVTADTVLLRPQQIKKANNADEVADRLSQILEMDRQEVYEKATANKSEVWLKRQISKEQYDAINNLSLQGVAFTVDAKRYYVFGDFLTQTLGFTSIDGEGLSGVESIYNKYLAGEKGKITTETDKDGRKLPFAQEEVVPPVEGYDVALTIDYAIQSFLENALVDAVTANKASSASGIVMNPRTGEILAMSTKPSYDLNNVPRDNSEVLSKLSRNKIITDTYELGSIMKSITLSAALEENTVNESNTFTCTGSKVVAGESIKCHKKGGHGTQTLPEALAHSCNPAFMEIGLNLGKEKLYSYYEKFGFTSKTGINFPGESTAIFLQLNQVREADLARIAFGQSVAVTPIQFVTAFNSIVNGGNLYKPYYVKEILNENGEKVEENSSELIRTTVSESTSRRMMAMMKNAIQPNNNAYIPGYRVGGKTATAQKYEDGRIAEGKYITSFVGVAPADDPQIVCLIMVDEPQAVSQVYGSTIAAPVAKIVMEDTLKYLNVPTMFTEGEENVQKVEVPDLTGMSDSEAKSELGKAGLKYQVIGTGRIENQFPAKGAKVFQNSTIMLYCENSSTYSAGEE